MSSRVAPKQRQRARIAAPAHEVHTLFARVLDRAELDGPQPQRRHDVVMRQILAILEPLPLEPELRSDRVQLVERVGVEMVVSRTAYALAVHADLPPTDGAELVRDLLPAMVEDTNRARKATREKAVRRRAAEIAANVKKRVEEPWKA